LLNLIITPLSRFELLPHLPKNGIVAEIGVWNGGYSKRIVELNRPAKLHLIDPWSDDDGSYVSTYNIKGPTLAERFDAVSRMFEHEPAVAVHRAYSYDVMPSFPDSYFDWVFIDGMHTYDAVKQDLALADPKVKADGFIIGHDFSPARANFGVIPAVLDFLRARPAYKLLFITHERAPTYVIAKDPSGDAAKSFELSVLRANPKVVEVPLAAAERLSQRRLKIEDGRKHVSFVFDL
jgi:hypothetical protein